MFCFVKLCRICFCGIVQNPLFKPFHIQNLHLDNHSFMIRQQGFDIHISVFHSPDQRNLIRINNREISDFHIICKVNHRIQKADENLL